MEGSLEAFLSDLKRETPQVSPLLVAYSGGVDSTVLLHALHAKGLALHAVHVNHQILAVSDEWEQHCEQQCARMGVPFTALKVNVDLGTANGLEAEARLARYRAIFSWMERSEYRVLLCAHHRDDQLETVLLQLLRGSGLRGIGGMRQIGPVGVDRHLHPHLLLGRPLLNCSKQEILEYASRFRLAHVEDPSNTNTDLRRNWVRHELLPQLEVQFPQSPSALLQLADFFQSHYSEEDQHTQVALGFHVLESGALNLHTWVEAAEKDRLNLLRHWLLGQGVRCGKLKLLELARQLQIPRGGLRVVEKGWKIRVSRQQAWLEHDETKDTSFDRQ